jgi:hypothetical protein
MDSIVKLLDKAVNNPEIVDVIIATIKLVDPKFDGLSYIKDPVYATIQAKIISALTQDEFNDFFSKSGNYLMSETLGALSHDKLKNWFAEQKYEKIIQERKFAIIEALVLKDLLTENCEDDFVNEFVNMYPFWETVPKSDFYAQTLQRYKSALRSMLIVYDGRFIIKFTDNMSNAALKIIAEHYANQSSMLKLERNTKDALAKTD